MGKNKKSMEKTYCNPLPMPDYPQGSEVNGFSNCRELADPTVLWYENRWILYATIGAMYESEDYVTWKVCEKGSIPSLVAPTIIEHQKQYYLMGSESPLYVADSPYGPFRKLGKVCDSKEREIYIRDPMLFSDEDETLYLYWGLGVDGIYGMELDNERPWRGVGEVAHILRFEPEHIWERMGAYNQNTAVSFVEGAWMHKHKGRYYMIYSASGTCYSTYAWGVYQSNHPLRGFVYQQRNPILRKTDGLVSGSGHGSIVQGPAGTLWAFYTIKMCFATKYERRIAMDAAGIDKEGNLFVREPSEIPQYAPGIISNPEIENGVGLLPLTMEEQAVVSSSIPGREWIYALDHSMLTWWQPQKEDKMPTLMVDLRGLFEISAARLIWRDVDLDYENGILPGPFRYRIEATSQEQPEGFATILDCSQNDVDYAVDYRTFPVVKARYVRLCIVGCPAGICPGVISFVVFGQHA